MNYTLGLYEKAMPGGLSLYQKLTAAREHGFEFVELSIDETDEKLSRLAWSREERKKLTGDMFRAGVPIGSICLSGHRKYPLGHPDPDIRARSLEIMFGAIDLAADLGIRIIQLAGYDVYYLPGSDETRRLFEENLKLSADRAALRGVTLAFETMETDFMNTVEKAMYWVKLINSPYLQVYPDIGNVTNAAKACGGSVRRDLLKGRGHTAAMHLKESRPGVFREVPFGTGHVDFSTAAKTAAEMGVRRFLAEFWYDGSKDWKKTLEYNSAFLRRYLDEAFIQ